MGFGQLIATALSVVVLLAAGCLIITGVVRSADLAAANVKAAADAKGQRMNTQLAISDLSGSQDGPLTFSLGNAGSEKVVNVSQMDVIVKFTGPGSGNVAAYWLPCGAPAAAGDPYWTRGNITSVIGDALNPGMLDPGESLEITVVKADGFPSRQGWVQVTAPNGACASANFLLS